MDALMQHRRRCKAPKRRPLDPTVDSPACLEIASTGATTDVPIGAPPGGQRPDCGSRILWPSDSCFDPDKRAAD
jgi:hypothetical protein